MSESRRLSDLSLFELYTLLVKEFATGGDDPLARERMSRIAGEMILKVLQLQPSVPEGNPRLTQTFLARFSEAVSGLVSSLTHLQVDLESATRRVVRERISEIGAQLGVLATLSKAPVKAPLGGLASRVDVSSLAQQLGGTPARVYSYVITVGRASSRMLSQWASALNIPLEELEASLTELVSRGLLRVEARGGELEYIPGE
ncbi:MAG: hypothetical protein ABWK01_07945 [Infirmifilum sp.]